MNIQKNIDKSCKKLTSNSEIFFRYHYSTYHKLIKHFHRKTNELNPKHKYRLKESHRQTLLFCFERYIKQLESRYDVKELNKLSRLPYFKTMATSIKSALELGSLGTVYAHRKRFLDTGVLIGCYADETEKCQFWAFNPIFLMPLEEGKKAIDSYVEKLAILHLNEDKLENEKALKNAKNAITTSIFEYIIDKTKTRPDLDREVSTVDKVHLERNKEAVPANIQTRHQTRHGNKTIGKVAEFLSEIKQKNHTFEPEKKQDQVPAGAPVQAAKRRAGQGVQAGRRGSGRRSADVGQTRESSSKFPPLILQLITHFWLFAKSRLYSDWEFTEEAERRIMNTIYSSCFDLNKHKLTEKEWIARAQHLQRQVEIAENYRRRNGLYLPGPEYYFDLPDPSNPREFKFYRTSDLRAKEVHDSIVYDIRNWQRGKGRHKNKNPDELKSLHFARLIPLRNSKWNDYYCYKTIHTYVKKA